MLAHSVADSLAALNKFPSSINRRKKNQLRMSERVISDDVPALRNFPGNIRPLPHVTSDQKKSGVDVMFAQNVQQSQGVRIIRSVVESEGEVFSRVRRPAVRQSRECPPKPLPGRRYRLIS
jgi:hypothetical protein